MFGGLEQRIAILIETDFRMHHSARITRDLVNPIAGRSDCRLAFVAYLAKLGWDITVFVRESGQISPVLDVSMAWLYGVLPVGFGLLALRYLLELVGYSDRSRLRAQSHLES